MKHLFYLLFSFSVVFAQVPSVWWVDGANGSDNNDGKSEATAFQTIQKVFDSYLLCLLYTSPSPRDQRGSRMPSSA